MTAREDALVGEACDPRDGLDDGAGLAEGGAAVCSSRTRETVCRSGRFVTQKWHGGGYFAHDESHPTGWETSVGLIVSHGLLVGGGTQLLQPKGK